MKKIFLKYYPLTLAVLLFFWAVGFVLAINSVEEGYQVNIGIAQEIDAHGVCKNVTNNTSSSVFIPTKTDAEWSAFRDNIPSGISLADCAVAGPLGCFEEALFGIISNEQLYNFGKTSDGGYMAVGWSSGRLWFVKTDVNGETCDYAPEYGECYESDSKFARTYWGSNTDYGYSIEQQSDGGYLIVGYTNSFGAIGYDIWLIKTDSAGLTCDYSGDGECYESDSKFVRRYGGSSNDQGYFAHKTSDGGYVISGATYSYGNAYQTFLIKTDSAGLTCDYSGDGDCYESDSKFVRNYGGSSSDFAYTVEQTSDNGYVVLGYTKSYSSNYDVFMIKTDSSGLTCDYSGDGDCYISDSKFVRIFGDTGYDKGMRGIRTSDGGYAIAAYTNSFSDNYDGWFIKTNSSGLTCDYSGDGNCYESDSKFVRIFDAGLTDKFYTIHTTSDGGYTFGGSVQLPDTGLDLWMVRTNSAGLTCDYSGDGDCYESDSKFVRAFGGALSEGGYDVLQIIGGYAIGGYTYSFGHGGEDFWLLQTNNAGVQGCDDACSVAEDCSDSNTCTLDICSGTPTSCSNQPITTCTSGDGCCLPECLGTADSDCPESLTFGGSEYDKFYDLEPTSDGGYFLTGYTNTYSSSSSSAFWNVKTDAYGNTCDYSGDGDCYESDSKFSRVNIYESSQGEIPAYEGKQTSDGGYITIGNTTIYSPLYDNGMWIIKSNSSGNTCDYASGDGECYESDSKWVKFIDFGGGVSSADYARDIVEISGGYVIVGYASVGINDSDVALVKLDLSGNILWSKIYRGGDNGDYGVYIIQTSDGGYLIGAVTYSYTAYGDIWLIKTDANGNTCDFSATGECYTSNSKWVKFFRSSHSGSGESLSYIQQMPDGGYFVGGTTSDSYWNLHWNGSYNFYNNFWVIRTDASGNTCDFNSGYGECWESSSKFAKLYGQVNQGHDFMYAMDLTSDGGYVMVGYSNVYHTGSTDADGWIVKADSSGNTCDYSSDGDCYDSSSKWAKHIGGTYNDMLYDVYQEPNGDYAFAGATGVAGDPAHWDGWFFKMDGLGNIVYQQPEPGPEPQINMCESITSCVSGDSCCPNGCLYADDADCATGLYYGGTGNDSAYALDKTSDGGYIMAGRTNSNNTDFYLVKVDSNGTKQWDYAYGGANEDIAESVQQTSDGGYIVLGSTYSLGANNRDILMIKTNSSGAQQWYKLFGESGYDTGDYVQQTTDGGYIAGGQVGGDFYIVKTNSSGVEQWHKTYGGTGDDTLREVQQTSDGGYIMTGYTKSFGAGNADIYLVKTDPSGNEQWSKTFGVDRYDEGESVKQTSDGGYIVLGYGDMDGGDYDNDIILIKTNASGDQQWIKTFGEDTSSNNDYGLQVIQTSDSGYALVGYTTSYGLFWDGYLIKTNSSGNEQWHKTYGGGQYNTDFLYDLQQLDDGGYILGGYSNSFGAGSSDFWFIKTDSFGNSLWHP